MLHTGTRQGRFAEIKSHYQEIELQSKLDSADPYTLVRILYEELENSFRVLKAIADRGEGILGHSEAHRAHSIVVALLSGLNKVENSNLSLLLADVYQAMAVSVEAIIKAGSVAKLDELLDGVADLRSAWERIPAQV